ncbi:MAG: FMN-binding protein [Planctomycetota bacterium]
MTPPAANEPENREATDPAMVVRGDEMAAVARATSEGATAAPRSNYIAQAWLVLVLALVFASGLAAVQITLGPLIAANKVAETRRLAPELLGRERVELEQTEVAGRKVFRASADGATVGWIVPVAGQGFADTIELIAALDAPAQTLLGTRVIDQKETPGLGDDITRPAFTGLFADIPATATLRAVKDGEGPGAIQAITGATISSQAVCAALNQLLGDADFRAALAAAADTAVTTPDPASPGAPDPRAAAEAAEPADEQGAR